MLRNKHLFFYGSVFFWKERTEKNGPKITKGILFHRRGEVIFLKKEKCDSKERAEEFYVCSGLEVTQPISSRDLGRLLDIFKKKGGNYLSEMT